MASGSSSLTNTPIRSRPLKRQHPYVLKGVKNSFEDKTNDYLCPICFELIEEAHITKCGHTFCFQCISKSLEGNNRCPKCNSMIGGREHIFPNFLLNELITKYKTKVRNLKDLVGGSDKVSDDPLPPLSDNLRGFVASESQNLALADVNVILEVLNQRKSILEAESCAVQNKLLHEFLKHLLKHKEAQLNQLTKEVSLIKRDINEVESILSTIDVKGIDLEQGSFDQEDFPPSDKAKSDAGMSCDSVESFNGSQKNSNNLTIGSLSMRRKRMHAHFNDFVRCYFNLRAKELLFSKNDKSPVPEKDKDKPLGSSGPSSGLDQFRDNLVKFSRFSGLRPLATLNYSSDIFNNSTIVSSIEFDKDNEFFAIAGVTKRIKVYDYGAVIRDIVDIHYPCIEMLSNSKISCLSWNSYHKNTLASSDYEGTVTVWDVNTGQRTRTFQEHEKRCWSVDFNKVNIRLIASGSDDARVKLWSLDVDHSVASLEAKANVCCVQFNPGSSNHLAFGSADHCVHYYDLRNMKAPLALFEGHRKAVSYVKFLNNEDIVSASTDSQLKLWNINTSYCLRSLVGHINEKNFVGLAANEDYIACGSENNALYVYYKGLTKQLFSFKFDAVRSVLEKDKKDDEANEFVSAVCWRQLSNVVVAANSQGIIKILELA
ncbi:E3 ubiquitin-protein ligase COP1 isoform X1 [Bemisia tabaci]|uniref:E3 ubiquitin-protein ligase COP1 isoform X1 n=1 Tax=Bemisia tabaci TaxID=7038 RepID=UPI0008F9D2E1|nr:PREDICTED: E3 ubiquitin-protein ligase RFWD2-like isoform X1 [Bemisia tabaci]